jgi:hypothetical protein
VLSTGQEMIALKTVPLARPRREHKPSSNARYSVSDGREARGVVDLVDSGFVAVTIDGSTIGVFPTLQQAARAFDGGAP